MSTIDELTALEAAISRTDDEQAARYRELIEINAFLVSPAAADPDGDIMAVLVAERRRVLLSRRLDAITQERDSLFRRRAAILAGRMRPLPPQPTAPDSTGRYS